MMKRFAMAAGLMLALVACQDESFTRSSSRHLTPIPAATMSLMAEKGMSKSDPILIRSYKKESEMEVWKKGSNGRYALLKTFPICRWSGQLGPKVKEGDRQAPEGFYPITPAQMNPNSAYYLSFNTGFPNAYDRTLGRTGGDLMVHGSCSSRGCFAMTDQNISEIYALAREALAGGQREFQFQSYPFRMTAQNLAKHRLDPNIAFWKNLKEGSDAFEVTLEEPAVSVSGNRYVFDSGNASVASAVAQKRQKDDQEVADLIASGVKPIRLVYSDGDTHESFREALARSAGADGSLVIDSRMQDKFGDVSRYASIASRPQEIVLDDTGAPKAQPAASAVSYAAAKPSAPAPVQQQTAPTVAAAPSDDTPFYTKMFNGVGDLFSSSATAQPAAETAQVAPVSPQPHPAKQQSATAPQRRAQGPSALNVAVAN